MDGAGLLPVRILGTGSCFPGALVTTEVLAARALPDRDPALVVERTGIRTRWMHDPAVDTVASTAGAALRAALDAAGVAPGDLKRLILVHSTGLDRTLPPTANRVAADLGIHDTCDAFDLNNACVGFVTALDLAARCVATGMQPVAIVAAELPTRQTTPEAPRPYLVLGDAAGAVVLGPSVGGSGIVGAWLANDGRKGDRVTLDHPRGLIAFGGSRQTIQEDVIDSMKLAVDRALAAAGLALADVRWALIHQANGVLFEQARAALGLSAEQVVPLVEEIGSVAAASVPVSLDRLARAGGLRPGDHVLMAAVGSGLAYGALIYRVG